MKIVRNRYLPPSRHHVAINLFGVFFVHPDVRLSDRLINHERIHTAQMRELGYLPFYLIYLIEWFIRLFPKGNAYLSIGFEREAYKHERDYSYLKHRKHYTWIKYLKKKNKPIKIHRRKKYDKTRNRNTKSRVY